jgi:hypothetical protein
MNNKTTNVCSIFIGLSLLAGCESAGGGLASESTAVPALEPASTPDASNPVVVPTPSSYTFQGGSGLSSSPYLISSVTDLSHISDFPEAYYELTSNINANGLSSIAVFSGQLDGAGYTISNLNSVMFSSMAGTISNLNLMSATSMFIGVMNGTLNNVNLGDLGTASYNPGTFSWDVSGNVNGGIIVAGSGFGLYSSLGISGLLSNCTANFTFNGTLIGYEWLSLGSGAIAVPSYKL